MWMRKSLTRIQAVEPRELLRALLQQLRFGRRARSAEVRGHGQAEEVDFPQRQPYSRARASPRAASLLPRHDQLRGKMTYSWTPPTKVKNGSCSRCKLRNEREQQHCKTARLSNTTLQDCFAGLSALGPMPEKDSTPTEGPKLSKDKRKRG